MCCLWLLVVVVVVVSAAALARSSACRGVRAVDNNVVEVHRKLTRGWMCHTHAHAHDATSLDDGPPHASTRTHTHKQEVKQRKPAFCVKQSIA